MKIFQRTRVIAVAALLLPALTAAQALTDKPVLYGKNWVAITGKPLAATAGAQVFLKGGNAVDATCAMLAAAATMWDTLRGTDRPSAADRWLDGPYNRLDAPVSGSWLSRLASTPGRNRGSRIQMNGSHSNPTTRLRDGL